jgi:hypothetical protein
MIGDNEPQGRKIGAQNADVANGRTSLEQPVAD